MRVRSLESRILGARPSESMSPGLALLNGEIGTRKVTGVIKDNTRRGLYCGMDFSDAPADGWLVLIYCFTESNSTGFCIAFGVNGKSEGHIYGFIYSGGWTDYVINFC